MVSINSAGSIELTLAEKRVSLYDVSWQAYQTIVLALGEKRSAQLTHYKGILEIMTPLEAHENSSNLINDFIKVLTEEKDLPINSLQSTTLNLPQLAIGVAPDQCYYVANEQAVRGRQVDLLTDPPPDLVLEVDITHTDINKNALYAEMGVREFWRYSGKTPTIYQLQDSGYREVEISATFPRVPQEKLSEFLANCAQQGETTAKRRLRAWTRQQLET